MKLVVHDDPDAVSAAVANRIAGAAASFDRRFTFGLSGGSTPVEAYRRLRSAPIDWPRVDAWVSDERWVPHGHERSNGRMARSALFDHVGAPVLRPNWGDHLSPAESAKEYDRVIRMIHEHKSPDLIHLGLGDDGHTASLFPGTAALDETERWIVHNHVASLEEDRITATFPLLWSARLIIVQATGAGKAEAVASSFEGETPAGRLRDGEGEVEWHIDRAASGLLS